MHFRIHYTVVDEPGSSIVIEGDNLNELQEAHEVARELAQKGKPADKGA